MRRNFVLFALIAVAGLALAGCGPKTASITVDLDDDFTFDTDGWTVPAGAELTVTLNNTGAVEHEWVLMEFGYDAGDSFGDEDEEHIIWEIEAEAGDTASGTFVLPTEKGTYQVLCGTAGHLEGGMVATLTLE